MEWNIAQIAQLCTLIQQIPAPTNCEQERADAIAGRFIQIGLADVHVDDTPNVYGRVIGSNEARAVLMSAHLDTVFPAGTDLRIRREGNKLHGPGIGDNSMGLAGLLTIADTLVSAEAPPACDVWFLANAGEEGVGDLRGMRRAIDRLGSVLRACIVVEGVSSAPWTITHRGLAVRRYRIDARARGGHSWGSFGEPSAIHLLVRLANVITRWDVPKSPRSTYNIGVFEGGTSVNTIAEQAYLLLDLRSESREQLLLLSSRTEELVAAANAIGGGQITASIVSDRPSGEIPVDHPLVAAASEILIEQGIAGEAIQHRIGSTDANIPLSVGIPAVTIYLTEGHDVHRLSEWLSLEHLSVGMTFAWQLLNRTAASGGF